MHTPRPRLLDAVRAPLLSSGLAMALTMTLTMLLTGALLVAPGCGEGAEEPAAAPAAASSAEPGAPEPVGLAAANAPRVGPHLVFEELQEDFGAVSDVRPLVHDFAFTNEGTEDVVISRVEASCGCTATSLERERFAPGEGDVIHVEWSPKGHGPQSKSIQVLSNSRGQELIELRVVARIQPFLQATPARVDFGAIRRSETHTKTVVLETSAEEFEITGVEPKSEHVSARLVEGPVDGRATLEVTVEPGATWGMFYPKLVIHSRGRPTSGAEFVEHELEVGLAANPYDTIVVEPAFFGVGRVPLGGRVRSEVVLSRPDGEPFQVIAAQVDSLPVDEVEVTREAFELDGVHKVRLTLQGPVGDYEGSLSGRVAFTTDVPGDQSRSLAVMGVVK